MQHAVVAFIEINEPGVNCGADVADDGAGLVAAPVDGGAAGPVANAGLVANAELVAVAVAATVAVPDRAAVAEAGALTRVVAGCPAEALAAE